MHLWLKRALLPLSAFLAGFSLMVMELTASRILAPIVGSSLYTWTSVIGIIMLGLAAGNFIGGYFIDKNTSPRTIFIFFLLSAISVFLIPLIASFSPKIAVWEFSLPLIIILITWLIFFLPSLFMGCVYPCLFKFSLKEFSAVGKNAGRVSALWTAGSIAGTFLTGFVFISYWGSRNTLWVVAALLLANGFVFYVPSKKSPLWLLLFFSALTGFAAKEGSVSAGNSLLLSKESAYYSIKVVDTKNKLPYGNARFMFLDFDSHGVEGSEIKNLNLYTNIYPVFSALKSPIKDILVIGGGPETITKNFAAYYRGSRVTNVEIDPQVSKAARDFFGTGGYEIKNEISDGRVFLQKESGSYDLIFNDAYNSFISVPWHLSTKEFNDLARNRLNEDGIYAVNFISAREGEGAIFFQSMLRTFAQTFPNHYIFSFNANPKKVQNIVLVGVNSKEHLEELSLKNKIMPLVNGPLLAKNLIFSPKSIDLGEKTPVLRDDFAPTEKLMAPIINSYFSSFSSFYYSIF